MKKYLRFTAVLLMLTLSACGAPAAGQPGLVTDEVTTDPDATRITAPVVEETTEDVNVRDDDTSYTAPVTTAPVTNSETRITFLAAGDNIIHENVYLDAKSRAGDGEKYNFIDMYAGIADMIAAADLAFINQETPICGDEMGVSGYPNFNTPEAAGDALVELGFDIVNVANNHTLDKKEAGYKNTLDYWHQKPVTMLGGYYDEADYEDIRVVEEQGVTIAFLSYTYGSNGMYLPQGSEMVLPYIDQAEIQRMTAAADKIADLVFVVMHWGDENTFTPNTEQKTLAKAITDAGADVIIGMHSHTIQPMEWMKAADGSETLVIYSLGNLISTQYDNQNLVGGMVTFDIVKDKSGAITIENPIFNPTVTHYNKQRLGLQVYLLEDYTEELVSLHGNPNYGTTAAKKVWTMERITRFVTDSITDEFLPDFLKSTK